MAPLPPGLKKPSGRSLRAARVTGSIHHLTPHKTFRPDASTSDSFLESKHDKRLIKHSSFLSRVASSSKITKASSSGGKKRSRGVKEPPQRRNLSTLDSLADALPELEDGEGGAEVLDGKIRHKSLKSKKGALKRKERLVKGEMERFGVSMAQLAKTNTTTPVETEKKPHQGSRRSKSEIALESSTGVTPAPATAPSNRWAALRGYISATMEQNPAFANKG